MYRRSCFTRVRGKIEIVHPRHPAQGQHILYSEHLTHSDDLCFYWELTRTQVYDVTNSTTIKMLQNMSLYFGKASSHAVSQNTKFSNVIRNIQNKLAWKVRFEIWPEMKSTVNVIHLNLFYFFIYCF